MENPAHFVNILAPTIHHYGLLLTIITCLSLIRVVWASSPMLAPAMIVFGDSTVDVGMNNKLLTVVKSNFRPYGKDFTHQKPTGRFCNGPIAVDYIANKIGLPIFPFAYLDEQAQGENLVYGANFASAGSGYYPGTATRLNVLSLTKQLEYFGEYQAKLEQIVGSANASYILSEALYVFSTGNDDFILNYYVNPIIRSRMNPAEFTSMLVGLASGYIEKVYNMGARRIAVISIAPLGCLPSQITLYGKGERKCVQFLNDAAIAFNQQLQSAISDLSARLPGARIAYVDCFSVAIDAVTNPSKYGFNETNRACCGTGVIEVGVLCNRFSSVCSNASKYAFWDSFHPSTTLYTIIAESLYRQGVPLLT